MREDKKVLVMYSERERERRELKTLPENQAAVCVSTGATKVFNG